MALRIGTDSKETGRISVRQGKAEIHADTPEQEESLMDLYTFYERQLSLEAADEGVDQESVTAVNVLKRMGERLNGRTWAIKEEDDPNLSDEEPDEEDPDEDEEPAEDEPVPTDNDGAWAFNDSGVLVPTRNVFCATGAGGGVDPTCSTGGDSFTVKPPKKLYRGVIGDGQKGAGTFSLGKGLYSTPSKGFLKGFKYDKVVELTPEVAFPRKPLVLRTPSHFTDWLLAESGERRISEFNAKYPDPGEFVRSKGYDGVVAGDEVVRYMPAGGA